MRVLIAIAALAVAAPAIAQTSSSAALSPTRLTLADTSRTPTTRVIIDGAGWLCDDAGQCAATSGRSQPAERACRRVVARLGAVTAFSWKGQELSADQLAVCNTAAA